MPSPNMPFWRKSCSGLKVTEKQMWENTLLSLSKAGHKFPFVKMCPLPSPTPGKGHNFYYWSQFLLESA